MTDVSKTNAELIAEARSMGTEDRYENATMIDRLADALEAKTNIRVDMSSAVGVEAQLAARVPVQGEPNDDRETEALIVGAFPFDGSDPDTVIECRNRARMVVAALASRATVPDAATAAIARVREVTDALRRRYSDNSDAAYFMNQILAALDGAPEPADEYGITFHDDYRPDDEPQAYSGCETLEKAIETAKTLAGATVTWKLWKRPMKHAIDTVPAGPWLPVEGERE